MSDLQIHPQIAPISAETLTVDLTERLKLYEELEREAAKLHGWPDTIGCPVCAVICKLNALRQSAKSADASPEAAGA